MFNLQLESFLCLLHRWPLSKLKQIILLTARSLYQILQWSFQLKCVLSIEFPLSWYGLSAHSVWLEGWLCWCGVEAVGFSPWWQCWVIACQRRPSKKVGDPCYGPKWKSSSKGQTCGRMSNWEPLNNEGESGWKWRGSYLRDLSLKDRLSWEQNTQTGLAFTRGANTIDAMGYE